MKVLRVLNNNVVLSCDDDGQEVILTGRGIGFRAHPGQEVDPDAIVLVAPMLGLRSPVGPAVGGRAARWMAGRGDAARPAWRGNERPATRTPRQMLLTHDRARYGDEAW